MRVQPWVALIVFVLSMAVAPMSGAETVALEPIRDATLIESRDGAWANGSGPVLFAGHTSSTRDGRRRALVAFDVAAAIPAGAWVTRAELHLELTPSNAAPAEVRLHRVSSGWSEGPSVASGGGGRPAEPGDATWIHASLPAELWDTPGGDFEPSPSAGLVVADAGGYVWSSTPSMLDDVQLWLDAPAENHGWIVIGNEDALTTSKRFASREAPIPESRPLLVVEFETSCEDGNLSRSALGLCRAYCEALQCWRRGADHGRACGRIERSFALSAGGRRPPCESD
jgi:hypothetical protein